MLDQAVTKANSVLTTNIKFKSQMLIFERMFITFQMYVNELPAPVHSPSSSRSQSLREPAPLQSTHVLYVLVFWFVGDVPIIGTFQFN